jgi:hypothetical protein
MAATDIPGGPARCRDPDLPLAGTRYIVESHIASGAEGAMVSDFQMRVSDTEREATATELREHYAAGRLTLEELNERLDKAFAAKTRADLNALMTDLPSARQGAAAGPAGFSGPAGFTGGPFGPGTQGAGWNGGSGGSGGAWRRGPAQTVGAVVSTVVLMGAQILLGTLGVFGIGAGRPFGIVLIIAALALLRRLIFGRRARAFRGCGPRRRRW